MPGSHVQRAGAAHAHYLKDQSANVELRTPFVVRLKAESRSAEPLKAALQNGSCDSTSLGVPEQQKRPNQAVECLLSGS